MRNHITGNGSVTRQLTPDEEAELNRLWKKLVKLTPSSRFYRRRGCERGEHLRTPVGLMLTAFASLRSKVGLTEGTDSHLG
ncbi:MAG TPA: hypothetical protein VNT99_21180 [Methylomirabilota bacterium]|nr:hypothetical protein [Methylomirabilota bacterium]